MINGQKMWTSLIQYADWIWLACRTDPDLPRHKGLSIILVPADAHGFSYTPVHTVAGVSTSATYFEDVRVPVDNLVGELNGGWPLMTNQLNHERVALTSAAPLQHSMRQVREWAQQTKTPQGDRVIDAEWVQVLLGQAHARVEMLALMNWKIASATDDLSPAEASATKVYGSELATEVYRSLMEIVGPNAAVKPDSAAAVLGGRLERYHRSSLVMTFGGGTNEIQRDIIGMVGLGLPPPSAEQEEKAMDFTPTPGQVDARRWPARCSPTVPPRPTAGYRAPVTASTRTCGRAGPRASSACPSPRSSAVRGSACSSWSPSSRRPAGRRSLPLATHAAAMALAERADARQQDTWLRGAATGGTCWGWRSPRTCALPAPAPLAARAMNWALDRVEDRRSGRHRRRTAAGAGATDDGRSSSSSSRDAGVGVSAQTLSGGDVAGRPRRVRLDDDGARRGGRPAAGHTCSRGRFACRPESVKGG